MKRFFILLYATFVCGICLAQTETINWYDGADIYTTTTCESGSDVLMPNAPVKPGYNFVGWYEFFNRGTFATWNDVPTTDVNQYMTDANGNNTPQNGDYIIVTNASDYIIDDMDGYYTFQRIYVESGQNPTIRIRYDGTTNDILTPNTGAFGPNDTLVFNSSYNEKTLKANKYIRIDGVDYYPGKQIVTMNIYYRIPTNVFKVQFSTSGTGNFLGTWLFRYRGDWATDGVFGWKPESQIE